MTRCLPVTFLFLGLFSLAAPRAGASVPTAPTEQCQVILKYEGLCGNSRPNSCLSKPGVDYWHNLEQQRTWDNYFYLCVNIPGNSADRYSHECIQTLGLSATCTSTVPDLVEYHAVTTLNTTATVISQPSQRYQSAGQISMTACLMLSSTSETVRSYYLACGDVAPAQCSSAAAPTSDYQAACGTKKPCECVRSYGCSADYCATTPSPGTPPAAPGPGTPPAPSTPGEAPAPASGDGGGPPAPGPAAEAGNSAPPPNGAPNGDSFVLGAPGEKGKGAAEDKASGCSLALPIESHSNSLALFWLLLPTLGLVSLQLRRFFHHR
ncbi:MAG: hypothetical protein U1F66_10270 [bacterium]